MFLRTLRLTLFYGDRLIMFFLLFSRAPVSHGLLAKMIVIILIIQFEQD